MHSSPPELLGSPVFQKNSLIFSPDNQRHVVWSESRLPEVQNGLSYAEKKEKICLQSSNQYKSSEYFYLTEEINTWIFEITI